MEDSKDLENISLPYIRKNQEIFSPGIWNNYYYSEDEIGKSCNTTNWGAKELKSLYLDHKDKSVPDWVGFVENIICEGGVMKGDLHIVDKPTAMKLAYGAKFGISPKVAGIDDNGAMKDFAFENWSIVISPACKTTYINNMEVKMDEQMKQELEALELQKKEYPDPKDKEDEKKKPEDEEKLEDESVKSEGDSEAEPSEEEEKPEAEPEEEKPEEELSEEELSEIVLNSDWTDFVKKFRGKYPKASMKDIAKAFKSKQTMFEQYVEMSKEDLTEIHNHIGTVIAKMEEEVEPESKPKEPEGEGVEEVKNEIESLKKAIENNEGNLLKELKSNLNSKDKVIQELSEKLERVEKFLNEPDKKAVKTVESSEGKPDESKDPDEDYLNFLLDGSD